MRDASVFDEKFGDVTPNKKKTHETFLEELVLEDEVSNNGNVWRKEAGDRERTHGLRALGSAIVSGGALTYFAEEHMTHGPSQQAQDTLVHSV